MLSVSALDCLLQMEDCGEASVSLGLEIRRDRTKKILHFSQSRYAEKVLERFDMTLSKPVVTPIEKQLEQQGQRGGSRLTLHCTGTQLEASCISL